MKFVVTREVIVFSFLLEFVPNVRKKTNTMRAYYFFFLGEDVVLGAPLISYLDVATLYA
mgnify:CR=1 FL=1